MTFEPRTPAPFTVADTGSWSWNDIDQDTHVGHITDEGEGPSTGMAFVYFRAGVNLDFAWPHDEIRVLAEGTMTIRTEGRT